MENYLDDYPGQIYTHQQDNYHGSTIIQIIILEKFQTDPQDNYPGSTNTYIGPLDFLIFQWDLYFENSPFDPQLFFHLHIQPVQPEKGILKPSYACILFALDHFHSLFKMLITSPPPEIHPILSKHYGATCVKDGIIYILPLENAMIGQLTAMLLTWQSIFQRYEIMLVCTLLYSFVLF